MKSFQSQTEKQSSFLNVSFFKARIKRRDEIFAQIAPASVAFKALARVYCLTAHAFCNLRKTSVFAVYLSQERSFVSA